MCNLGASSKISETATAENIKSVPTAVTLQGRCIMDNESISYWAQTIGNLVGSTVLRLPQKDGAIQVANEVGQNIQNQMALQPRIGQSFIRVAGISGVCAVGLGAYGAHVFREKEKSDELKLAFESANKYHMLHTLALLSMPLMNRPLLVGTLMTGGMLLFSGSCYYHALTGDKRFRKVTPYGGILLMVAWASMIL